MRPRALILIAAAASAAVAAGVFARAPATSLEAAFAGKPEIIAATFASAWCSSCKILEPKLANIIPGFSAEPVSFVEFDFTFGPSEALASKAAALGLQGLYERNKGATGFTVLIDAETGEILDTLTMNFSESAMRAAIARAIVVASYTDEPMKA
jgi:hypothetical protein